MQENQTVTKKTVWLVAVGCSVASAAIAFGAAWQFFAQKTQVPQIRLVNMAAVTQTFNERFTTQDATREARQVFNANRNYLGNQGVVLLNTNQIVSAPAALLINHEALLPKAAASDAAATAPEEKSEKAPAKSDAKTK